MSTNKMATKADLQELYQRILPYLGGMPEVLANKFSKGDMYSADEKMIGQWIDGKPLYSKTIQSVIPTAGSDTTVSLSSLGIDSLVNLESSISVFSTMPPIGGYMAEPSNISITRVQVFVSDSGTLYIRNINYGAQAGKTIYVTLKYTKTTDSPVSIGNDTDYSTTEKIVGTWIDGRPIWQKTVSGTMPAAGSDTKISVSSDVVDFALTCKGVVPEYRTQPLSDYIGTSASTIFLIMTFFDTEEQKVYLRNTGVPAAQNKTAYVTVTYVKATS